MGFLSNVGRRTKEAGKGYEVKTEETATHRADGTPKTQSELMAEHGSGRQPGSFAEDWQAPGAEIKDLSATEQAIRDADARARFSAGGSVNPLDHSPGAGQRAQRDRLEEDGADPAAITERSQIGQVANVMNGGVDGQAGGREDSNLAGGVDTESLAYEDSGLQDTASEEYRKFLDEYMGSAAATADYNEMIQRRKMREEMARGMGDGGMTAGTLGAVQAAEFAAQMAGQRGMLEQQALDSALEAYIGTAGVDLDRSALAQQASQFGATHGLEVQKMQNDLAKFDTMTNDERDRFAEDMRYKWDRAAAGDKIAQEQIAQAWEQIGLAQDEFDWDTGWGTFWNIIDAGVGAGGSVAAAYI